MSSPSETNLRRFCRWAGLFLLLLVTATMALNIAVDPFMVFDAPRIAGFNLRKTEAADRATLAQHYLLARSQPQTLALGNSKAQIGIDPASPFWPDDAGRVHDGAIGGQSLDAGIDELRDAVRIAPIRRALILAELTNWMWVEAPESYRPNDFLPTPLGRAEEIFLSTLSLEALNASVSTILRQKDKYAPELAVNGALSDGAFRGDVALEGASALFEQKLPGDVRLLRMIGSEAASRPDAPMRDIAQLRGLIDVARRNKLKLDIVLPPTHVAFLVMMDHYGLWQRYLNAKSAITQIVAEAADDDIRLWDFTGFDQYSTELVAFRPDRSTELQWFWEPSHFKRALGEKILEGVYRSNGDYGVRLTPQSLPARLRDETAARDAYYAAHPDERAWILQRLPAD